MGRYILKRLIISLFTVWVLVTAVFFLVRAMPGDPFLSDKLTPEIREHMMRYHGFDQPLYVQYLRYLGELALGELCASMYYNGLPIRQMIA